MADFTHLHVHSEYSLLDGLAKIDHLLAKAMELGMDSLALTDHGVLYGAIKFYLAAKEFEIKPIIGVEAYLAARSRFDKQADIDADRYHLILLAKNEIGYKNLLKLVTLAHLEGFYYKPRVDKEILRIYHEGIIATSACLDGEIPELFRRGEDKKAVAVASDYVDIFGKDFYLEIQHHPKIADQKPVNEKMIKLSRRLGIPLVATNDVHYVEADDAEAQDALLAVQTQKLITDPKRMSMIGSPDFYLKSQEEMRRDFADIPEAIENTRKISRLCNLEIQIGKWIFPNYPIPSGTTAVEELKKITYERLKIRYPKAKKEIVDRIDYELNIISKKGFATYFLIVQDFVNWAKSNNIRVGPGRGSVAGSLVSYILRITSVDPLKHNLPFERFMNPQRPSPPDIDLDFADDRRDEVIEYITQKYGVNRVAQIVTFNVMKAKEAIRDVGRVLGMPYSEPDKIAKLIPLNMNIADSLNSVPELSSYYREPKYKKLLDLSQKVEGTVRHASTHAAGIVIGDLDLNEYTPLQKETKGEKLMTQYDMYSLDLNVSEKAIGLLKIDILGLRNLTILEKALEFIKQSNGVYIDLSEIPLDDKPVFKMIANGDTTGIFQFESAGMRRLARKLKPNKFTDLSAMVALYRPGPMQFIDEFIAGKINASRIKYPHPDLKPVLAETYGIAVYQEQILHIANIMGGYSLGEADILRRAIGKKKKSIMTKEKNKFIKRAIDLKYKKEVAENVWSLIERFAGYGFNKAHSTSYAMITYQTAYLKNHYPVEFMAALLTAESGSSTGPVKDEKIARAVEECRHTGIVVLPPDINQSKSAFTIEEIASSFSSKGIRFGLSAVKNVGEAAINAILAARDVGGKFKTLSDILQRVDGQKVNKKVLESLIKVGALDHFGKRAAMLFVLEKLRSQGITLQKQKTNGQTGLFDGHDSIALPVEDNLPQMDEFSTEELLASEKSLLGIYLTANPIQPLMDKIDKLQTHKLGQLDKDEHRHQQVKVGGMIADLRIVTTRATGKEMAFVKIEDETGSMEIVVFPSVFAQTKNCWVKGKVVLITGKVEYREEKLAVLADKAQPIEEFTKSEIPDRPPEKTDFEVKIPSNIASKKLMELNRLLKLHQGNNKIALVFVDNMGGEKRLVLPFGVDYSQPLATKIKDILKD
jgi:DNA polymerase-3 subunit alpha